MPTTNPIAGMYAVIQIQMGGTTYTAMTGMKTADLQISTDIYDITDLNNNLWKIKLAGLSDYTIKLGGNFDLSDAQQAQLQADVITTPGQTVLWKVYPAGTGTGKKAYAGTALIKTQGVKFDVKAEEQVSWDMEGSGQITYS